MKKFQVSCFSAANFFPINYVDFHLKVFLFAFTFVTACSPFCVVSAD